MINWEMLEQYDTQDIRDSIGDSRAIFEQPCYNCWEGNFPDVYNFQFNCWSCGKTNTVWNFEPITVFRED